MASDPGVVTANVVLLERAFELIGRLPDAAYAGGGEPGKPVGPHFRHVLEHYSCFLAGLAEGRADYDARPREAAIETDRSAARRRIRELIDAFGPLLAGDLGASTAVRLECGLGDESEQWSRSTVRRELQFLLSHTVHHFALIGLLLDQQGIDPGPDFGVAPSTLKYWHEQLPCAPPPG